MKSDSSTSYFNLERKFYEQQTTNIKDRQAEPRRKVETKQVFGAEHA